MAIIISSKLMIARVDNGQEGAFYDVHAWLRDTCIPAVRPLYSILNDHSDSDLKAAGLVKHLMSDSTEVYELVLYHGALEKRYKAGVARKTPTLANFIRAITGAEPSD